MRDHNLDIVCIPETWLLPNIQSTFVEIPEYSFYRNDGGRGGGVGVYIRRHLKVNALKTPEIERPPHLEDIWLTIQSGKFPSFILGCVYRHPHALSNSFDYLSEVFRSMCLKNKPLIILGDFNDDLFIPNNKIGKLMQALHLSQLVSEPTRITANSSSLIDLIITNKPNFVVHFKVLPCPVGDHELLTVTVNVRKDKKLPTVKTVRSLENYSQNYFCDLLLNELCILDSILYTDCVNNQVSTFTNVFIKCLDMCAPYITILLSRPPAPWIDSEVKEEMKRRDDLQRQFKANRQNSDIERAYKREKKPC